MARAKRAKPKMRLVPAWPARPNKPGMRMAVLVESHPDADAQVCAPRATGDIAAVSQQTTGNSVPTEGTTGERGTRPRATQARKEVHDASSAQPTTVQEVSPGFSIAYYAAQGDALAVKEYRWQPKVGQEVPLMVRTFAPPWLLRDFTTEIVITMVWARKQ